MNILFICDVFPPDTLIGGIRPFMFAKYLQTFGHRVTIINSGRIYSKKDDSYLKILSGMEVYSAYTTKTDGIVHAKKQKNGNCPSFLKRVYRIVNEPLFIRHSIKSNNELFRKQRDIIDSLGGRAFDVVFSTYAPLASIKAGRYAANKFRSKWIMDFRDALVQPTHRTWLWNRIFLKTQQRAVQKCDLCTTVSKGVGRMVSIGISDRNVVTLYNGYDSIGQEKSNTNTRKLSFCYTGNIYGSRMRALIWILRAIAELKNVNAIDLNNIVFNYAGSQSEELALEMKKYGIDSILNNNGYLSTSECDTLQRESDVFIVLSWNTKEEKGILTGKFFEGVRAQKPMLISIVGDTPESELAELNYEYNFGFCFEEASSKNLFNKLCEFIQHKYNEKMLTGNIEYVQNERLTDKFKYENLSRELESLCYKLIQNA